MIEVKTGSNPLKSDQLENYLDIARDQRFDAVITVSNEIPAIAGQHPTAVDRRKLRKVALHHLSWTRVLTEAVMQKEFRGVADPDQAWILGELIRYLEHPKSGAMEFDDMSDSWVDVRDAVRAGTLRATDPGVAEVASRFDALLRFASLRLGRQLGTEVTPFLSRRELTEPHTRTQTLISSLVEDGRLAGAIRVPDTVGHLNVLVDLRAKDVTCFVDVDAPREGRATTRVNWLVRQLKNAPDGLRVEAFVARGRGASTAGLLRDIREDASVLVADRSKEIRSFRVACTSAVGGKRGRGRGAFIDSILNATDEFYAEVLQNLKAWSAAPPRVRQTEAEMVAAETAAAPDVASTALSSQDEEALASTG